jgi:TetR/AcrR family transcriptional repressor of uid operon
MRTTDPELHQRRREDILQAARGCFARQGFAGTGMKELCEACELSPGALYRYFPSKDAIIETLVEEDIDWVVMRIEAVGEAPDPLAGLHALIEAICAEASAADLALHMEVAAEQSRNRALRESARRADKRCHASLTAVLEQARAKGEIPPDRQAAMLAEIIIALIDGWLGRGALHGPAALRASVPALHEALRCLLAPDVR